MPASGPLILAIDAAGSACAAAIAAGDRVLAIRHMAMLHGQAEALLPMVDRVVREAGLAASAIELIAVTTGPGSFTGIRAGIAAARGIALATGRPLIGITSFEAAAEAVAGNALAGRSLLVALESRRADLYVQVFDPARHPRSEPAASLPETLPAVVAAAGARHAVAVAGDAAARAAPALSREFDVLGGRSGAPGQRARFMRRCGGGSAAPPAPCARFTCALRASPWRTRRTRAVLHDPPRTGPARSDAGTGGAIGATPHAACFPEDPWPPQSMTEIVAMAGVFGRIALQDAGADGEETAGLALAQSLGAQCEILTLGVIPARRRAGIGRALLAAIIEEAQRCGALTLFLEVAEDNIAARTLYATHGFVQIGRRTNYYRYSAGLADALVLRFLLTT